MLDIKINNHYVLYNYYLTLLTLKLKQITPKKTHRHICIVKFDNKALEDFELTKIFNHPEIIKTLPCNLQKKDNISTVTYKLGKTIRNKILNYKDVVNSI